MIPVPAPATLEVLRGRTLRPSGAGRADHARRARRCSPPGREEAAAFPELTVQRIGLRRRVRPRWDDAPNLLRAVLGEATASPPSGEAAWVLEANLDDLSPQLLAAALEAALAAGAHDAWVAPVTMKKGRPGTLRRARLGQRRGAAVEAAMFRADQHAWGSAATRVERSDSSTGSWSRWTTAYGKVRVKVGRLAGRGDERRARSSTIAARRPSGSTFP